jgi:FkbM family methyltransferase
LGDKEATREPKYFEILMDQMDMGIHEFRTDLIQSLYTHIYRRVEDNFDYERYSHDGVDRSKLINVSKHANYLNFVLDNIESLYESCNILSDIASRNLYIQLIKYRSLGHAHIRIKEDKTWTSEKALRDKAATYVTRPSEMIFQGLLGDLQHHEIMTAEGKQIKIDAWCINIAYGLGSGNDRQYYFERDGVCIRPEKGDYVIDGGACFGDTSIFFSCSVGSTGKIFAFEPLPRHINIVKYNIHQNALSDQITLVSAGIGEASNHIDAIGNGLRALASPGFSIVGNETQVPVLCIDDFVNSRNIVKMDFIKMDIEGFELNAIKGAALTIEKHKPKLAISLYHKPQDFFEIPIYLKTHFPFYRFYLDHYTIFDEETVLYAIAD